MIKLPVWETPIATGIDAKMTMPERKRTRRARAGIDWRHHKPFENIVEILMPSSIERKTRREYVSFCNIDRLKG